MNYKYIHLIIKSRVRFSLKNLIGSNKGHKIFIVENNSYKDINGHKVQDEEFLTTLKEAEVIFAHFLSTSIARLINKYSTSKKIVWFSWGGDIYNLGKFQKEFLQNKTKKLFYLMGLKSFDTLKKIIARILGFLIDYLPPNRQLLQAIKKVDIIVPVILADYKNLKNTYKFDIEVFQVNYASKIFKTNLSIDTQKKGEHILLGNSASFTNNHIEAIDIISKFNQYNSNIYIPISYGRKHYAKYIQNYARKKLGNRAQILTERLPYNDYAKLYASCKSVIMNHNRQQAMGNIFLAFWAETTLYMNSSADHYLDLTNKGFKILDISNFDPDIELSEQDRKRNKELLREWYGLDYQKERFELLLQRIEEINN